MASLVLKMSVSLDGYVAPVDGTSDWAAAGRSPTIIARGDLAAAVTRVKQERPDGYLLAQGVCGFARSLVQTGLIDEYRLVVHPVILGAGERLFTMPLTIQPLSTTAFSRGAVAHVFAAHPSSTRPSTVERTLSPHASGEFLRCRCNRRQRRSSDDRIGDGVITRVAVDGVIAC